jgi:CcmD family protein
MRAACARVFQTVMMIGLLAAPAFAQAPAQPPATPPPAQDGFQPFVPGQGAVEQLPATPLVFTAYALVWIIVVLYVWSIWRRLARVETEVRALQQKGGARRP